MDLNSTRAMIGDCGITLQEVDGTQLLEIGYHLRRDLWGQGFATEAGRACRDYGFTQLSADLLISLVRPENLASCRVAERNGLTIGKETNPWDCRAGYTVCAERNGPLSSSGTTRHPE